jgi:hypothetical protein
MLTFGSRPSDRIRSSPDSIEQEPKAIGGASRIISAMT